MFFHRVSFYQAGATIDNTIYGYIGFIIEVLFFVNTSAPLLI